MTAEGGASPVPGELSLARSAHLQRYGVAPADGPPGRTTRCLSAAVHFDAKFSAALYDEFLAEPYRAVAPSPGLDSAAVLREAAAAMVRRRIRDMASLALLVMLLVLDPFVLPLWILIGALWRFVRAGRWPFSRLIGVRPRMDRRKLLALVVVVSVLVGVLLQVLAGGFLFLLGDNEGGAGLASAGVNALVVNPDALVVVLALYLLFAADRLIEWSLATGSFREGLFAPRPLFESWPGERLARTGNAPHLLAQIDQIAMAAEQANVIVYRGPDPFVGAGEPLQCWSMAIPLRPKRVPLHDLSPAQESLTMAPEEIALQHRFTPSEMHAYVRRQFDELRSSLSLAPSGRLRALTQQSVLIAAASELLAHRFDHPAAQAVLPALGVRPSSNVPESLVDELADNPVEWMRHFTRFQVESWERDLVVSGFLHLGCDNRMLYVEWNALVLYPIRSRLWTVDLVSGSPWPALRRAVSDLVACPAAVPSRLGSLRRPASRDGKLPMYSPSKYGSHHSIRELAAGDEADNYFQDTDVERYRKLMERHVVASTMSFLDSKGLSTAEFAEQAATIVNNFGSMLLNTGSLSGVAAGGNVTTAAGGASPTVTPTKSTKPFA